MIEVNVPLTIKFPLNTASTPVSVPVNIGFAFGASIFTAFEYAASACVCADAARVFASIALSYAFLTLLAVPA